MSLENYKITDAAIARNGVVAAPDKLTGTAAQNKAVFDRLIRETVREMFNGLIDTLACEDGAAEVGTAAIPGVTGGDVQTVLGSLKTLLDTKSSGADVSAALALKSDRSETDRHIKSVSFNAATGVFTFTREDGSYVSVDTVLEKVATNWRFDADTQSLVLTLADGTVQSVPLSAFITETEFSDSGQIAFSVSGHRVTATVKAGSITDAMLSSALAEQLQNCVSDAASSAADALQYKNAAEAFKEAADRKASDAAASAASALRSKSTAEQSAASAADSGADALASRNAAADSALLAESYARGGTGIRAGEDVDNALYYKNRASEIAGGDFATRGELSAALSAHDSAAAAHGDIRAALEGKQPMLAFDAAPASGSTNPVTSGGVYAAIQNAAKRLYVHTFTASDWTVSAGEATLTIGAATHGLSGNGVLARFSHLIDGGYVDGTWACVESRAEIDAATHTVTLRGPAEPYGGRVVLLG